MQDHLTLVEILLGKDHYLIDGDIVDKFVRPLKTVDVYDAPPYIEGMAKWGDDMIPVINIAPLLGMDRADTKRQRTLIIPEGAVSETGMAVSVDDVFSVRTVIPSDIMPADISAVEGIEEYVKGLIRLNIETEEKKEELLLLYLNLHKMLTDLLKGKIARPAPDFYVWRWDNSRQSQ
ncbi:MAG TPA: chemotaxis protein CheW [Methanospirillum sp.]|jgi:chemotaxis signal transduction protein|uniref:chemotaxis protein CheW n=1 Tax=Methanospirillum sp. TaxID=45200 RepID=UPI0009D2AA91|nr:chemotaxis protein CheW [Methanospirillum sp.]OQB36720.1 MAG: CheW-like domain protein [Euryarchaeota archaeon ADurb.Bin165]HPY60934.1 chemotaxis protein CheW [Methanospirillum sp.]HQB99072.1 chemotaxis protein CheW [Methanospirillum sp.]